MARYTVFHSLYIYISVCTYVCVFTLLSVGKSVPIRSDRIHAAIRRVEEAGSEVEQVNGRDTKLKLFSRILLDCQEAVQSLKDEIGIEKQSKQLQDKEHRLEQLGRLCKRAISLYIPTYSVY